MDRLARMLPWVSLLALAGGFVSWVQRDGDFAGYLTVGELVLQQRHIYADAPQFVNTWPPVFSVLCVPLALLAKPSPYLARAWWIVLNFTLVWAILRMLATLVYDRPLHWFEASADALTPWSAAIGLPCVLTYRFILGNFDHLQINIVIFALALAGLYHGTRRSTLLGGLCLGAAAAVKVMPIVFVPYLFYRRQWRLGLASAVAAVAVSLSPTLLWGWDRFVEYVGAWRDALAVGWGVGKMNQSVFAMLDRLIGHGITPLNATEISYLPESVSPLPAELSLLLLAAIALVALVTFRGAWRLDRDAGFLEVSIVFLVSALFGPLTWKAYLVVLLCPMTLLVRIATDPKADPLEQRIVRVVLAVFFLLAGIATPGILGKRLGGALEMLSITTWSALLVLGLLFWLRYRRGMAEAPAST